LEYDAVSASNYCFWITLKMEAANLSETSVTNHNRQGIVSQKTKNLHHHRRQSPVKTYVCGANIGKPEPGVLVSVI
jgi:hypothetical protein